ncbi:MAG: hypothetical protein SV375_11060, partial [Thermodesulfobacteriota bacterium]|nr:hypothetical protein [Thermodesulfobacteriota bacterium]
MKIRKKICKILVCIPIMIFFGFHELQAFEVPLVVENPRAKKFRGVSRENAPVMGGVPLPPGQIKRTEELCLKDQYGSTVAVQISPMVRYQDGSLQWVLLNFLTNIKAGETLHFRLIKASGTAAVTNPVKVRNDSDSITLSNDILEIKLRRKGFNGISHLNLYGKEIIQSGGVPGVFMAGKGKFLAGEPVSARFEYRGLLRTTLCIKGPYVEFDSGTALDGFGYTLRLTMFANSPILRAEYLLKNTSVQRGQNLHIRQAWMDLQIVDANKVNVHGGSLTFRSSVGNGFFHIRHKGAF